MIEAGAPHNLEDRGKSTPLVIAAENNEMEILKYLLEA
jgi:ankyrin repeat protein